MTIGGDSGAIPLEEFAELRSEVHHLISDFREHKTDTRSRFDKEDVSIESLKTSMNGVSAELGHLTKTIKLASAILGPTLLAVIVALLTKVFTK